MKVRASVDFSDRYRRAIRYVVGRAGLATRAECVAHLEMMLDADAGELCSEMDEMLEGKRIAKQRNR